MDLDFLGLDEKKHSPDKEMHTEEEKEEFVRDEDDDEKMSKVKDKNEATMKELRKSMDPFKNTPKPFENTPGPLDAMAYNSESPMVNNMQK